MRTLLVLWMALSCPAVGAIDRVVNLTTDDGDGVCDATCTLRDAVQASAADDRVLFDLSLPTPLVLELTGAALSIAVPMRIVGNDGVPTVLRRTGGSGRLLQLSSGADVRIVGLGFEDGIASAPGAAGGAVHVAAGAELELRECVFRNNQAVSPGGLAGQPAASAARGGAIHSDGVLLVEGCAFVGNRARGGPGGAGDVPGADGGDGASARGGAIHATGSAEVLNSTFHDNRAVGGAGGTGAANVPDSGLADGDGGDGGDAAGGALWIAAGSAPTTAFSTLIGNAVEPGPGGLGAGGSSNPPGAPGASGLSLAPAIGSDSDFLLDTSVVAANAGAPAQCGGAGNFVLRSANLVEEASCPGTVSAALPSGFEPIDVAADSPHYAPGFGSPAVDATPDCLDALGAEAVDLDQLLTVRPLSGDGAVLACDFGAVELDPVLFADGFEEPPPAP